MNDRTDSDLLRRYASSETAAFGELYEKYYHRLFSYCYRLLQNRENVEDIVQSVFVKALESINSLEKPELFYYWLFTIARNEVYGALRKTRNNGTVGLADDVVTLRASNPDFVPATLDAVKQWTFIPASRDGKPIKAEVTIPFKFKLGEGGYKSGYEDLMKLKENTVQLVQGKTTEEILSQIDGEAYIVIGNRMEHLPGLVRDKGKRGLLLEGPESKVVSTRLKADFSVDSAFLVLVTKPDSTSAERYHTVVFFKSEAGNWKIYAWHTSLRR